MWGLAVMVWPEMSIVTVRRGRRVWTSFLRLTPAAACSSRATARAVNVVETDESTVVDSGVDLVLSQPVAGAVVLEFDPPGEAVLAAIPDRLPVVAAAGSTRHATVPHVIMDDRAGAIAATGHLLALGHRTVHHVAIPPMGVPAGRSVGWHDALEAAGVPIPPLVQADWEPSSGYAAGLVLARDPEVTAVLCGNDELAFGVMRAFAESGLRVPEDVSVVGFDGHPLADLWSPPLTTVEQDFVELGRLSFGLLEDMLEGRPVARSVTTMPRLIVRQSTGPRRDT